jgi:hypothetical protein
MGPRFSQEVQRFSRLPRSSVGLVTTNALVSTNGIVPGLSATENYALLAKHRLSNNVGVVNQYWRTLQHALDEERHFALVEEVPIQPRLARNQGSGLELGPTYASLRSNTAIMITTSSSPVKRSGMPYELLGVHPLRHIQ